MIEQYPHRPLVRFPEKKDGSAPGLGRCRPFPEPIDDAETARIPGRAHDLVEHVTEQVHHNAGPAAFAGTAEIPERKIGVCSKRRFEVT